MSSEALEARLADLRQVCFAPSDGYSAGEWCEAANEGVQIALALLAALAVAREREQRLRDALQEMVAAHYTAGESERDSPREQLALRDARAALVDEPAAAVTHGRHCPCSACAREDWARITGPCGMHGADCPAEYAPGANPSSNR